MAKILGNNIVTVEEFTDIKNAIDSQIKLSLDQADILNEQLQNFKNDVSMFKKVTILFGITLLAANIFALIQLF